MHRSRTFLLPALATALGCALLGATAQAQPVNLRYTFSGLDAYIPDSADSRLSSMFVGFAPISGSIPLQQGVPTTVDAGKAGIEWLLGAPVTTSVNTVRTLTFSLDGGPDVTAFATQKVSFTLDGVVPTSMDVSGATLEVAMGPRERLQVTLPEVIGQAEEAAEQEDLKGFSFPQTANITLTQVPEANSAIGCGLLAGGALLGLRRRRRERDARA